MKDFDKFKTRFVQFGGMRLVCQYVHMGVFWTGVKALIRCVVSGKSFKAAYPAVTLLLVVFTGNMPLLITI